MPNVLIPAEDAPPQTASGGNTLTPIHEFDMSPITASTADRDELARMWLAKRDYQGGAGPQTLEELQAIKTKAAAAGMTLDDVMAAAQEKSPWAEREAIRLYRNQGPVGRGIANSVASTETFLVNSAYRGLSFVPGWEHLSTKADENNRALETAQAVSEELNREGSLASIISPTGASIMGHVAQGITDVATVEVAAGAGAAPVAAGRTAESAAAANKAAALSSSKKLALYFGAKTAEQQLTVGTDAGLSPEMRIANSAMSGSIAATFTYGFGNWAQQLGLSTIEQGMASGSGAVSRLLTREGVTEAAKGYALSAGEQSTMGFAQQAWGSVAGTDTMDDWVGRATTNAATGALMRAAPDVLPAAAELHAKWTSAQEKLPDTVRGTLDAQKDGPKIIFGGAPTENAPDKSPAYNEAYQSEIDALQKQKADAAKALDEVKLGEESLKAKMDAFLAAKKELGTPMPPEAAAEQTDAIRAERDALVQKRKDAEFRMNETEQALGELSDADKTEIKAKVHATLETSAIKDNLDQGKVELTRAENALNRQWRGQEGYAALPEHEKLSFEQAVREARDKGIVAKADDIAKDIVNTRRGLTPHETAGLIDARFHREGAKHAANEVLKDSNATEAAKQDAKIRLDNARKSEDVISQALEFGATPNAQAQVFRKFDVENTHPSKVRETAAERHGGPISEAVANDVTAKAEKLNDIQHRARRIKEESETIKGPLSRDGFTLREVLRAEQRKGEALAKAEAEAVRVKAAKLYDTTADPIALDAARTEKTAKELYHLSAIARGELDLALLNLEPKTFSGQAKKGAILASNLFREFLTGGDLAPALRQGILHPRTWPAMMKGFIQATLSERGEHYADYAIGRRKYAPQAAEGDTPLRIMKKSDPLSMQESGLMNSVFQKFPVLRRVSAGYRVAMNELRMGAFEALVDSQGGVTKWDSRSLDRAKEFTNLSTGYSTTLAGFEQSASALSHILLAPRYFWSRLQYFTGVPLMKAAYAGDKMASQVMLKTYVKQVAGLAIMTALAEAGGKAMFGDDAVEFHRNPGDFDFGRMRIGGTMIDITGGLAKPYRYMSALGEPLLAAAQDRPSLKRVGPTLLGIGRSALAPVPSALVSAAEVYTGGKDANGELKKYIMPWSWGDSVKAMQGEGVDKGTAIMLLNLFGAGGYTIERK